MQVRTLVLVTLLAVFVAPGVARAQEAGAQPDYEAAKQHFKAGQEMMQQERFAEAIIAFKKAYEITQDGLVMGQVADAYARAGDYEAAAEAITVYRDSLARSERGPANRLMREYQKAIKEGRSRKLAQPAEEKPEPAIAPPPLQPELEPTVSLTDPQPEPQRGTRFYTWIAAGATGALALSAIVVGLSAQSKYDDLSNTCKPNCFGSYASEVDSVETRALVADILWGAAAAGAIATGVFYWWEGRKKAITKEAPQMEQDDAEDDFLSRLRVNPVVGVGSYGMSAGLQF